MTKYEKIAEWIIGQNVDHSLKSSDIIEIAETEFNTKLTKAGINYVKEALLDRGYTNLKDSKCRDKRPHTDIESKAQAVIDYYEEGGNCPRHVDNVLTDLFGSKYDNVKYTTDIAKEDLAKVYDTLKKDYQNQINRHPKSHEVPTSAFDYFGLLQRKFKDSPDWETLKKSKDFVLRRLFKELEEEKAKPMSVMKENNIAEIKSEIRKRAKEIKNVPNDIYDSKFKDEKYIVYLNGEPYYTAKSYDEATQIESQLYSASNTDEDFQGYYGNYPDVKIKKVKDCRFKDTDEDEDYEEEIVSKTIYLDRYDSLDSYVEKCLRNGNLKMRRSRGKNKYVITGTEEDIEWFVKRLQQTSNTYIVDSKSKDSDSLVGKKISWDRRALYGVILSENDPLTNKTTIEETSTGKVYFVSTRLLQKAIANGEAKIRDSKLTDAKLTHKQKLWYGEELEKFIYPQYLKRNYTLKRIKRGRKTK